MMFINKRYSPEEWKTDRAESFFKKVRTALLACEPRQDLKKKLIKWVGYQAAISIHHYIHTIVQIKDFRLVIRVDKKERCKTVNRPSSTGKTSNVKTLSFVGKTRHKKDNGCHIPRHHGFRFQTVTRKNE